MKAIIGIGCALALALTQPAAAASEIFNNGASLPGAGGPDLSQRRAADDFVLGDDYLITGGSFVYKTTGAYVLPTDVKYYIFEGTGPNDKPGALLASGLLDISGTTELPSEGAYATRWEAAFTLETAFLATSATRYWFALNSQSAPGSQNDPTIYWVGSAFQSPTRTWQQSRFDSPAYSNWQSNDYEYAYTLRGLAVPEPQVWALMLAGFGLAGAALRRSRAARA